MKILLRVLGELLEEQSQEGVNVGSCCDCIRDRSARVRVANIDWLIEEDHASIVVPAVWIEDELNLLIDTSRTEFEEKTCQAGATWSTVQPAPC